MTSNNNRGSFLDDPNTYADAYYESQDLSYLDYADQQDSVHHATYEENSASHLLLLYPMMVISSYGKLVSIVALTRLMHLMIDIFNIQNKNLKNVATIALGYYQISNYLLGFNASVLTSVWSLIFSVVSIYVVYARFARRPYGLMSNLFSLFVIVSPIMINEYYIHIEHHYHRTFIRIILMILSMKLTSQLLSRELDGLLELTAYFVHPASCICGPWHLSNLILRAKSPYFNQFKLQISTSIKNLIIALVILFTSDILLDNLIQQLETNEPPPLMTKIFLVYLYAQQFRFSHYFMCYLSMSFMSLWEDPKSLTQVCKPLQVEWPRSLSTVVVCWNIPIHRWLKNYVFNQLRCWTNNKHVWFITTYLVSSTLHGFKFHIWSVLFSLAMFAWIEENFRYKLSQLLSACILAKECNYSDDGTCSRGHIRTVHSSYVVCVINFSFRLWVVAQLAYLGYIFKVNTDESSYQDALISWSELYFYCHLAALATWILSILITKHSVTNPHSSKISR